MEVKDVLLHHPDGRREMIGFVPPPPLAALRDGSRFEHAGRLWFVNVGMWEGDPLGNRGILGPYYAAFPTVE